MTLELGGHAPFIVTNDADVDLAAQMGATLKFRNAGQVCAAPTRFYIQSGVYEAFMERFVALTTAITLGDGFDEATRMGPLSSARRVTAMNAFVHDAVDSGGSLIHGGAGGSGDGVFFPTHIVANPPGSSTVRSDDGVVGEGRVRTF